MMLVRAFVYWLGFAPRRGSIFHSPSRDAVLAGAPMTRGTVEGIEAFYERNGIHVPSWHMTETCWCQHSPHPRLRIESPSAERAAWARQVRDWANIGRRLAALRDDALQDVSEVEP